MKKLILIVTAFLAVSTSVDAASFMISASLSNAKISIDRQVIQGSEDSPFLTYKNRIYVPIRTIAEELGTLVGYNQTTRTASITSSNTIQVSSATVNQTSSDGFTLSIFSDKTVYTEGEPLTVWARFFRTADVPETIYHGAPLITYTIADQEGFIDSEPAMLSLTKQSFESGGEYLRFLPLQTIISFAPHKKGDLDLNLDQYINQQGTLLPLPKGTYTITATAKYLLNATTNTEQERNISAKITIRIQ